MPVDMILTFDEEAGGDDLVWSKPPEQFTIFQKNLRVIPFRVEDKTGVIGAAGKADDAQGKFQNAEKHQDHRDGINGFSG